MSSSYLPPSPRLDAFGGLAVMGKAAGSKEGLGFLYVWLVGWWAVWLVIWLVAWRVDGLIVGNVGILVGWLVFFHHLVEHHVHSRLTIDIR